MRSTTTTSGATAVPGSGRSARTRARSPQAASARVRQRASSIMRTSVPLECRAGILHGVERGRAIAGAHLVGVAGHPGIERAVRVRLARLGSGDGGAAGLLQPYRLALRLVEQTAQGVVDGLVGEVGGLELLRAQVP